MHSQKHTKQAINCNFQAFNLNNSKLANDAFRSYKREKNHNNKLLHLQKALIFKPDSIKYNKEYAFLLENHGDSEQAMFYYKKHKQLKKSLQVQKELGISSKSILKPILDQYYTDMYHNWDAAHFEAAELLENKALSRQKIKRDIQHSDDIKLYGSRIRAGDVKRFNASHKRQAVLVAKNNFRRVKASFINVITGLIFISSLLINNKAQAKTPEQSIELIENRTIKQAYNQALDDEIKPNHNKNTKHAPKANNNTKQALPVSPILFLFLITLPIMALARAALPNASYKSILFLIAIAGLSVLPHLSSAQTSATGMGRVRNMSGTGIPSNLEMWLTQPDSITTHNTTHLGDGYYTFDVDFGPVTVSPQEETKQETRVITGPQFSDVNITYPTTLQENTARVLDMTGKVVDNARVSTNGKFSHVYWNGENSPTGTYIIKINDYTHKVITNTSGKQQGNKGLEAILNTETPQLKNTFETQLIERNVVRRVTMDSVYLPYQDTVLLHEGDNGMISDVFLDSINTLGYTVPFKITDNRTGDAINNVKILLKKMSDSTRVDSVNTNLNGEGTLTGIPKGEYIISWGDKAGYLHMNNVPLDLSEDMIY